MQDTVGSAGGLPGSAALGSHLEEVRQEDWRMAAPIGPAHLAGLTSHLPFWGQKKGKEIWVRGLEREGN